MERGQMSKYVIKNGNLGLKRYFVSGFQVNFLQLIPIQTIGVEAYSLFSGYDTVHKRVKELWLQPIAIKEEINYQNAQQEIKDFKKVLTTRNYRPYWPNFQIVVVGGIFISSVKLNVII